MLKTTLLLVFLTVLAKCEKDGSLDRTEAFPGSGFGYFEIKESRFQSQQVLLLTEFSRFMNKQALKMLKDFVSQKNMYQAEKTLQKLKRHNFTSLTTTSSSDPSNARGESFLKSTHDAIKMAKYITQLAEHSTKSFDVPNAWENACFSKWWPFDDKTCAELRCTACAPAIMSAGAVCKATKSSISYRCLQRVMSEGYCNFCISDYIEEPEK